LGYHLSIAVIIVAVHRLSKDVGGCPTKHTWLPHPVVYCLINYGIKCMMRLFPENERFFAYAHLQIIK
jgi:hypothetical protein